MFGWIPAYDSAHSQNQRAHSEPRHCVSGSNHSPAARNQHRSRQAHGPLGQPELREANEVIDPKATATFNAISGLTNAPGQQKLAGRENEYL